MHLGNQKSLHAKKCHQMFASPIVYHHAQQYMSFEFLFYEYEQTLSNLDENYGQNMAVNI